MRQLEEGKAQWGQGCQRQRQSVLLSAEVLVCFLIPFFERSNGLSVGNDFSKYRISRYFLSPKDEAVFCTPPGTAALHRATVCWCWSSVFTSPSALIPQVCTHNWCCCRFLRPNALVSSIIADVIILRLAVNEASQDRGSPPVSIEQTVRGGFCHVLAGEKHDNGG